MKQIKYLILGAGPAGLTFANMLKKKGEDSFLMLEKEAEAGGLCRSAMADGSYFDIGGGHFLDVKRPEVNKFLFEFMPQDEWNLFERDSRIAMGDKMISHPLEANIWQFSLDTQVDYLSSIAKSGCNRGEPVPSRFIDWIVWKLGEKIANEYMIPYNEKMFSNDLNELGTYWLEKLPDVSFEDTLRACLTKKPHGTQPGHARFYYPKKYGYGELWLRMAKSIEAHILYHTQAEKMDCDARTITTASGDIYKAEIIVTTIPWAEFKTISGMPKELEASIRDLKSSAIETRYVAENLNTKAHWIYIPAPDIPYHRILVRHNFCQNSRGYWTETRLDRISMFPQNDACLRWVNPYAYPLNTVGKPEIMKNLLNFCTPRQIYGLGRWGEHSHYNSDVVVELAMNLAHRLT